MRRELYVLLHEVSHQGNWALGAGTTFKEISKSIFEQWEITLPTLEKQKKIGNILNVIDEKIEVNRSISANLEKLANNIYNYWFLQFDFPNENGRPYKSSGGKMVWNNELNREIPHEWEAGKLSDLLEIKNGRDHKILNDGAIPVYGSGGIIRYVDGFLYNEESVLIPRKGTLNNILYVRGPFWTVDTMFYTRLKKPNSAIYTYLTTKTFDLERLNTGSAVPSMTSSLIYSLNAIIPKTSILEKFDKLVTPLFDAMLHITKENKKLMSIRDFLIPLLMNGQVRVK